MLDRLDIDTVFEGLAPILRVRAFKASQRDGLAHDLEMMMTDPLVPSGRVGLQRCAYWIYTDWIESGYTFQPVKEKGSRAYFIRMYGPQTARGKRLGNRTEEETLAYVGKGKPQTTGRKNYETLEKLVREHYPEVVEEYKAETGRDFDLTIGDQPDDANDPDNMLRADISYISLVAGTTYGLYGPSIGHYINEKMCDYGLARHSVNVQDRASEFKAKCPQIERVLKSAVASHQGLPDPEDDEPTTPPEHEPDDAHPADEQPSPQPVVEVNADTANVTTAAVPVRGGGHEDEPLPVTEKWYQTAKVIPTKVYGALTAGGVLSFSLLTDVINFVKDNRTLIIWMTTVFVWTLVGLWLMHLRYKKDRDTQKQEFELQQQRLQIASDPTKINAK